MVILLKTWLKALILIYLSVIFFGSLYMVGAVWTGAFERFFPSMASIKVFLYYFFAGSIGASLRHLYMFTTHYMKGELTDYRKWIMYIFYPIFATGTSAIAVTLIESGILLIEFSDNQGKPFAEIGIGFLIGFSFNRFLDKLNSLSQNIFRSKNKTPDAPS